MFSSKMTTRCLIGVVVTIGPLWTGFDGALLPAHTGPVAAINATAAPPTTSVMVRDLCFHVLGLMPTIRLLLRYDIALRNVAEVAGSATASDRRSAERFMKRR